jgi:hypothetical protein
MERATTPGPTNEQTVTLPAPIESLLKRPFARWAEAPIRALTGLAFVDRVAEQALALEDPSAGPGERFARAVGPSHSQATPLESRVLVLGIAGYLCYT